MSFNKFMKKKDTTAEPPIEKEEIVAKPDPKPEVVIETPVEEVSEPAVQEVSEPDVQEETRLENFQIAELETLAVKYEMEVSDIIKIYEENASDPSYDGFPSDSVFRMVKSLIGELLAQKGKTEKISILALTKFFSYSGPSKKHPNKEPKIGSSLIYLIPNEEEATMENQPFILGELTSWDKKGGKIYQCLNACVPLFLYEINVNVKNTIPSLSDYTEFNNPTHLAEEDESFDEMDEFQLFEHLIGLKANDSVENAGLSEKNKDGWTVTTDLKMINVIISSDTFKRGWGPKSEDFPDTVMYQATAIDFRGNTIKLRIPGLQDYNGFIPEGQKSLKCSIIGPISMFNNEYNMDLHHYIIHE